MRCRHALWHALSLYSFLPHVFAGNNTLAQDPITSLCVEIAHSISSAGQVFFPGDPSYDAGIFHFAVSSTQQSKCVVEPGTPEDVGKILVILGRTRTPFAVKGGGHATNVGFSSTLGVHIAMSRFSEVNYNSSSQTADVGAGLVWDDVYAALEPFGVNVVGGRVTGIGVAGFTLGGGYSWKSNQFGLAVDNVIAFELVLPNGRITTVTEKSDPSLFFGLKGGENNFGIVTKFKLKTFPQTEVWGGSIDFLGSNLDAINNATIAFQAVTDPKAAIIASYGSTPALPEPLVNVLMFYDAPNPPPGIFDAFLAIPSLDSNIGTRSFLSLVQSAPSNSLQGLRSVYQGFPILSFTAGIAEVIVNETLFWGERLLNQSLFDISYSVEIFLPSVYSHNSAKTAYPPVRNIGFQPFNIACAWNSSEFDSVFHDAVVASSAHIHNAAIAQGQTGLTRSPIYPNYAVSGTPLADMYGSNLPALRALKARVDPENVMGLAGGWKF
ncbi:FAD-binding domain-containing protein [Pholiota conissans]|uniref:FAD-binding domain-containing protein n=1 Tax=Pholiota conissans TaxID=109636 RepID=A0A9P5YSP9_9AGAR|nr:FAD-binding domain-containing protein [Pholiota conissans]